MTETQRAAMQQALEAVKKLNSALDEQRAVLDYLLSNHTQGELIARLKSSIAGVRLQTLDALQSGGASLNSLRAALAEPEQSPEDAGYVPLSADGRRVFIDGVGEVPLAEPEPVAERNREWHDGFLEGRLRERQYWLAGCCMNTAPPARRQHAEIESLKAECDAMDQLRRAAGDRADGYKLLFDLSDAACKKAEAERDALRADAERYRWLKQHKIGYNGHAHHWIPGEPLWDENLDAAIDAAREARK